MFQKAIFLGLIALSMSACSAAPFFKPDKGRLLATGAVSQIEGSAGSGLTNWAVISGYGSNTSWGGNTHYTQVELPDFQLRSYGASVGIKNRVELSYTRQDFDLGDTGPKLGLRDGYTFSQDIVGAKVRLVGDAVYDQDSWLPQISVGAQYKKNQNTGLVQALGAQKDEGVDVYISGTKLLLNNGLILTGTARGTKANQLGLLGFGGDKSDNYQIEFEGSAAYMFNKHLAAGVDYRTKPDNLGFAKENDAAAAYVAWFPTKNLSLTAAYVDLGDIALQGRQRGVYGSIQVGF